ncbi:MAG TPA: formate C-acetyltransferase/glycerol dehydratase family glycyl radical enzyme [Candidatus Anaerostipes excrementavium]|uniref:Formate C-acetyltransferase/glycerol dehydratase family glycyl radical enzyme n=1 Tax=Candidatus Anaerostipes excrementavium TaxID=2838463 RepID=A0A9D1WVQ2_9FIRM|nr:formate C-acetyltransferase/glycerol dehydratase family glycyl radical enzyme [uncultured Anaerostipes sp.]HIX68109.1 formate C-acetyltransferase/glycerol dehydratase family glycyl radical enzyme [Candidatus Anaerostipes excrementavium]
MKELYQTSRVSYLKDKMLSEPRYASIEQALIITDTYKKNEGQPRIIQRAKALKAALEQIEISAEPEELIVGNRTAGVRYGVVFPESGSTWVDKEFETLPTRPQDRFNVHPEDIDIFRKVIKPYWKGKSLEDILAERYGKEIDEIAKVVKINQKDHAQGHICPNCVKWLKLGPKGIQEEAEEKRKSCEEEHKDFYESVRITMEGARNFMIRYHDLMMDLASKEADKEKKESILAVAENCKNLSKRPPQTFHEAVQSIWFLFVILQMESNASSFSPGRLDRHLISYYTKDLEAENLTKQSALEIIECLWLKFNEIVYMRNSHGAKYFAGFPIGFNVAVGGQDENGKDYANDLSFLFLQAQKHLGLPQPNLSVRLHEETGDDLLKEAVRTVAKGSGMPQFFNDKAVIPSIQELGISEKDALDYAIVGCVELTTQGNNLGWSDSAMFNMNKALEAALTGGVCFLTGESFAPDYGNLEEYETFEDLEEAFRHQIDYFMDKMLLACEEVEKAHIDLLPSPFLSSVIDHCMEDGIDVTSGGAKYNLSGIQMIQVANLADSLAAIKQLVYDEKKVEKSEMLEALKHNFEGYEFLRAMCLNKVPKYGNDVDWVDVMGTKWAEYFKNRLRTFKNYRGGPYHTGMYTVSAHVPMGENVGATPDGRRAGEPLADGGMSPVYGRDVNGPTAVLKSVSKLDKSLTTNGGLLNMKFLPEFFKNEAGIDKFAGFLRSFVDLEIPHVQFNVVRKEDLIAAKENPEQYRGLTVRVAGYTAYFTELADELQNEIIARTSYGDI